MIIENKVVEELFKERGLITGKEYLVIVNLSGLCAQALCQPKWFTKEQINALRNEGNRLFGFTPRKRNDRICN